MKEGQGEGAVREGGTGVGGVKKGAQRAVRKEGQGGAVVRKGGDRRKSRSHSSSAGHSRSRSRSTGQERDLNRRAGRQIGDRDTLLIF